MARSARMSYLPRRFPISDPAPAGIPDIGTDCSAKRRVGPLQLHDLFLFGLRDLVDAVDVLVGEILDRLLAFLTLVLGDLLLFLGVLDHLHRVATRRTHGNSRFFGLLADNLRELLAALLRERRNR